MANRRLNFLRFTEDATPVALRLGDVVPYGVGGYVADAAVEFAAAPQVAAPVRPPQMRERLKQQSGGNALEQVDDTRNTNVRLEANKQMHVVAQNLHLVDDETVFASDLAKHALANTLNLADQNLITILRAENHVKTNLPETMAHTIREPYGLAYSASRIATRS